MAIFCKIVILYHGRNKPSNTFVDVTNKGSNKSCGTVVEVICYELGLMNLNLEWDNN